MALWRACCMTCTMPVKLEPCLFSECRAFSMSSEFHLSSLQVYTSGLRAQVPSKCTHAAVLLQALPERNVFTAPTFLQFIAKRDPNLTRVGMCGR